MMLAYRVSLAPGVFSVIHFALFLKGDRVTAQLEQLYIL